MSHKRALSHTGDLASLFNIRTALLETDLADGEMIRTDSTKGEDNHRLCEKHDLANKSCNLSHGNLHAFTSN